MRILVVEEEESFRNLLLGLLRPLAEVRLQGCANVLEALELLPGENWDALVVGLASGRPLGASAVSDIRRVSPYLPLVALAPPGDSALAVESMRLGADDFLCRAKVSGDELLRSILYARASKHWDFAIQRMQRWQASVAELGQFALRCTSLEPLLEKTVQVVQQGLGCEFCKILALSPDRQILYLAVGSGWRSGTVESYSLSASTPTLASYTLLQDEPVAVEDFDRESRFRISPMLADHGVRSALSVVAQGLNHPYGVLSVHFAALRKFRDEEVRFLKAVANALGCGAQRVQAEEALKEENRKFRSIFETANDGILIAGNDSQYLDANPAACKIFGFSKEELLKMKVTDLEEVSSHETTAERWTRYRKDGSQRGIFRLRRRDGEIRELEYNATTSMLPGMHLSIVRDVTESIRAERDLRRSESKFRWIFESNLIGVLSTKPDGTITEANENFLQMLGYSEEDLQTGRLNWKELTPEDWAPVSALALRRLAEDGHFIPFEKEYFHKNGHRVPALVGAANYGDGESFVCFTVDLTEKKRLEREVAQGASLASLGRLVAGVAHEINNPLAYSTLNLEEIQEKLANQGGELEDLARRALDGVRRVQRIVSEVKGLSRVGAAEETSCDTLAVMKGAICMAEAEIRGRARLIFEPGSSTLAKMDPERLAQVLVNLIMNAAQAVPPGRAGEVRLVCGADETGRPVLTISDNGSGIPAEALPKIFDPFFTTKPAGMGTGLGLPLCKSFVEAAGGSISVESQEGIGTSVRLVLLKGKDSQTKKPGASALPPELSLPVSARVLMVDDEPLLVWAATRALSKTCEVVGFTDSREALALLQGGGLANFDLLLCDISMPGISGIHLYEAAVAHSAESGTKFIFMTGGAQDEAAEEFLRTTPNSVLLKPFSNLALRDLVYHKLKKEKSLAGT